MDHIVTFSSRGSGWIQFWGLRSVLWEWFQAQAKCKGGPTQSFLTYRVFLILEWPNWKHFSAGGKELSAGCLSRERRSSVLRKLRGRLHHWDMEALFKVRAGPQQMAQLEPQAHREQAPVQGGWGERLCLQDSWSLFKEISLQGNLGLYPRVLEIKELWAEKVTQHCGAFVFDPFIFEGTSIRFQEIWSGIRLLAQLKLWILC